MKRRGILRRQVYAVIGSFQVVCKSCEKPIANNRRADWLSQAALWGGARRRPAVALAGRIVQPPPRWLSQAALGQGPHRRPAVALAGRIVKRLPSRLNQSAFGVAARRQARLQLPQGAAAKSPAALRGRSLDPLDRAAVRLGDAFRQLAVLGLDCASGCIERIAANRRKLGDHVLIQLQQGR